MNNRLCELCHYRNATLTCVTSVDNIRREVHLCAECAADEGFTNASAEDPDQWVDEFSDSLDADDDASPLAGAIDLRCPHCNTSREEFERTGLLGCARCYESFGDEINVLMRRLHGATRHSGRRPRPRRVFGASGDEAALRQELHRAITEEHFERAAELRDLLQTGAVPAPPHLPSEAGRSPLSSSSRNGQQEEISGNEK